MPRGPFAQLVGREKIQDLISDLTQLPTPGLLLRQGMSEVTIARTDKETYLQLGGQSGTTYLIKDGKIAESHE